MIEFLSTLIVCRVQFLSLITCYRDRTQNEKYRNYVIIIKPFEGLFAEKGSSHIKIYMNYNFTVGTILIVSRGALL